METTKLVIWRTDLEFYDGITKEETEDDEFDLWDYDSDNDTCIETVDAADGRTLYERNGDDSPLFKDFTGAVRLLAAKEIIEIEHEGDFDVTKLDCTGDQVEYDGETYEADSAQIKSEDVLFLKDGEEVS